jgi:mono/diheme cytochrome c family protein
MKTKFLITAFILLVTTFAAKADPPTEEGKTIFMTRCAACHNINKQMTGPALAGIDERRSIDWIINFVHSSQAMIKKGDKDAVALFEKFNKVPMPDHPDLTGDNIKSIVEYIRSQSAGTIEQTPFAKPSKKMIPYMPLSIQKDYGFFIGFLAVVIILILALLFAVQSKTFQRNMRGKDLSA